MERLTRRERQQQTRQRLLAAAARLFAEQGLSASLDDVAAAAGLTKGAVYSNFPNKEALLLELIKERSAGPDEGHDAFRHLIDRSVPLERRLDTLAAVFDTRSAEESNRGFMVFMVEFWAAAMRNPRMLDAFAGALRDLRAGLAARFSRQFPHGELPVGADEFAVIEMALDIGFLIQRLADPQAVPGRYYASAVELIFGGALGDRVTEAAPDPTGTEPAATEPAGAGRDGDEGAGGTVEVGGGAG